MANIINRCTPTPAPLLDPTDRFNRGFQHDATGYRLCPIQYDFQDAEYVPFHFKTHLNLIIIAGRVKAKIRNQDPAYPTNASFFFNGLYKGLRGDPLDVEKGFLKSRELIKVLESLLLILFTNCLLAARQMYPDIL